MLPLCQIDWQVIHNSASTSLIIYRDRHYEMISCVAKHACRLHSITWGGMSFRWWKNSLCQHQTAQTARLVHVAMLSNIIRNPYPLQDIWCSPEESARHAPSPMLCDFVVKSEEWICLQIGIWSLCEASDYSGNGRDDKRQRDLLGSKYLSCAPPRMEKCQTILLSSKNLLSALDGNNVLNMPDQKILNDVFQYLLRSNFWELIYSY